MIFTCFSIKSILSFTQKSDYKAILSSDSTKVPSSAVEYAKNLQFGSRLVGKHRQLTLMTKKRSSDLLKSAKGRAIIPPQLNNDLCSE